MQYRNFGNLAILLGTTALLSATGIAQARADVAPQNVGSCTTGSPSGGTTVECTTATDGALQPITANGDSVVVNVASGVTLVDDPIYSAHVIRLLNNSTLHSEGTIQTSQKNPAILMQDNALIDLLAGSITQQTGTSFNYLNEYFNTLVTAGADATVNVAGTISALNSTALYLQNDADVTVLSGGLIETTESNDGLRAGAGLLLDVQAGGVIRATGTSGAGVSASYNQGPSVAEHFAQITVGGTVSSAEDAAIRLSTNSQRKFETFSLEIAAPVDQAQRKNPTALIEVLAGGSVTSGSDYVATIVDESFYGDLDTSLSIAGTVTASSSGNAVQLGGGNDSVRLVAGAQVTGSIDGGTNQNYEIRLQRLSIPSDLGTDRLSLDGAAGTAGTLDLGVTPLLNFEQIQKVGAGSWTLVGNSDTSNSFAGAPVQVNGGKLIVDATATNMALDVNAGAVLGGMGTVAGFSINTGGILAPGSNGVATLSTSGSVSFAAGSFYTVDIAADGSSDMLAAGGSVTIDGGTVIPVTIDPEADYTNGQLYTIVTAETGLSGTFDGILENSALLDYSLSYDADAAYLTAIVNPTNFTDVAGTVNQSAIGTAFKAFDFTGDNAAVQAALAGLTEEQLRAVYDSLQGETHADATVTAGLSLDAFMGLLAGGRTGAVPLGGTAGTVSSQGKASPWSTASFYGFVSGFGSKAEVSGRNGAAGFDSTARGIALGVEANLPDYGSNTRFGLSLGQAKGSTDLDNRAQSSDVDTTMLGLYGSGGAGTMESGLAFNAAAAYGWHNIHTERRVSFGTVNSLAEADYDAKTLSGAIELRYNMVRPNAMVVSPFGGLSFARTESDAFTETGAGALNLSGKSDTRNTGTLSLGVAVTGNFEMGNAVWQPTVSLAGEHVFGDTGQSATLKLAGSPTSFRVNNPGESRDRVRLGLGTSVTIGEGTTMSFETEGVFSDDRTEYSGQAKIQIRF